MKGLGRNIERLLAAVTFAEAGEQETARDILRGGRGIAAAVVRGHDASPILTYSVNAAVRNKARLDILIIDGSGAGSAELSARDEELVRGASLPVRLIAAAGTVKEALLQHAHREKDILFFVADPACLALEGEGLTAASLNRLADALGRPLVQVESQQQGRDIHARKEWNMSPSSVKKKPVGQMFVMGIISIALYTLLLTRQDVVNGTFGKGGWHALLPIATAFVFSFVHGSFTGDFWTVLGIEAARKKKEVK